MQSVIGGVVAALMGIGLAACGGGNDNPAPDTTAYDVLIRGGTVIDGTGRDGFSADIGVKEGRIAFVGDAGDADATRVIDAGGLVVSPGFVDTHSHAGTHSDGALDYTMSASVLQGVTTIVEGPDGFLSPSAMQTLVDDLTESGFGVNYALHVGHNGIRREVMGVAQRAPTNEELEAMKALVREGMEMGAVGLSAGLMYEPGMFSDTEELTALAREVAPYGGIYDSHSRNPVAGLLESEQETIEIATAAGIPARLAHLKAVGLINRDKTRDLIALVEAARADGHVVVSDQYPYDGAATALLEDLLVFPDAQDTVGRFRDVREIRDGLDAAEDLSAIRHATEQGIDGGFSWVKAVGYGSMRIVDAPDAPDLVGENLELLAAARGIEPFDLLISLIQGHDAAIMITLGAIEEREVQELMVQPWNMIASDGAHVTLDGRSRARHPRSTGSFARVLGHYVRDLELLTLPEAIRKMSSFPADHLGLHDRGRIAVGKVADIAVFNPATVRDRSTWTEPHDFAEGVRHVLVNGVVAVSDGRVTGELAGTYVKRQNGTGK